MSKNDLGLFQGNRYNQKKNFKKYKNKKTHFSHGGSGGGNKKNNDVKVNMLPKDTGKIIQKIDKKEINVNLLFSEFIWTYKKDYSGLSEKKEIFNDFFKLLKENDAYKSGLIHSKEKRNKVLEKLKDSYNLKEDVDFFKFSLSLNHRLIVGLGNPSPAETGILLHHIYGIPYIPGSALKGIARWSAIVEIAEKTYEYKKSKEEEIDGNDDEYNIYKHFAYIDKLLEKDLIGNKFDEFLNEELLNLISDEELKEELVEEIKKARCIFGTKSSSGSILFLDSFPDENVKFKVDIMNPHYPDYYDGAKKPPADWQNPIPIPFLTVEGGKFKFILVRTKKPEICKDEKNLLKKAVKWLEKGLTEFGVGAKTALGYGLFKPDKDKNQNV